MGRVNVNGQSYDIPNGASVCINNNKIIVDGIDITNGGIDGVKLANVTIEGDVNKLDCGGSVEVKGNVRDIDCGGSCTVEGNVSGDIDCGGSCRCGNVGGDIDAGGSVHYNK